VAHLSILIDNAMTQTSASAFQPSRNVSLELDSPELARTYEEVSTRQFEHGKVLISALAPRRGERVLDVGCGTGRLGEYVAQLVGPEGQVIGIDPLPLRIDIAARKNPRFQASVGRAEDLSRFADASFDVVYLNSVFHWIEDKPAALREARRVLSPGGRLGVNSADSSRLHQSAELVRKAALAAGLTGARVTSALGTNHRVSATQLESLLRAAQLVEVQVEPHTFVDTLSGVDDLLAWSSSSSFGNFLSDLNHEEREQVRQRLSVELEALRTPLGIKLERYLVFATARRP
jgi:arsenite methyltransferase